VNYNQLQELYDTFAPQGFTVLAFPCNQFGNQEPGTDEEIKNIVRDTYGCSFPLFSKVKVNGADAHPVWKFLKAAVPGTFGQTIKWNFTKFLVNSKGVPVERYPTTSDPKSFQSDISSLLNGTQ